MTLKLLRRARARATAYVLMALVALCMPVQQAQAQVVVTDTSLLLKAKDALSTLQSQLSQFQQMTSQVQRLEQTIGSFGPSVISGFLSSLPNLGQWKNSLSGLNPTIQTSNFTPSLQSNSSFMSGINQLQNALTQAQNGITQTKTQLQNALYLNTTGAITQAQQEAMVALRNQNMREASANAMSVGMQTRADLATNAKSDLDALTASAKAATDTRGDTAAANAIMLKILEQLQKQNALLASLAHLQGAASNSGDTIQSNQSK